MLDLSKSMVTCSIDGDAYDIRWWYIALLVGYKPTAEHYRGSADVAHSSAGGTRCYIFVRLFDSTALVSYRHI